MTKKIDRSCITSQVEGRDVEITCEDFHLYLDISRTGLSLSIEAATIGYNWTEVNRVLHSVSCALHLPEMNTLSDQAHVIQHVLRNFVVPKVGDRGSIAPYLSLAT